MYFTMQKLFTKDKCTSCVDNYFYISNKCLECNTNCKTSNDGCKCDSCDDGYYLNNGQCLICNSLCKTCSNSATNCLSCFDGKYLLDNQCLDCDIKCKTCITFSNHCTSCNTNTISYQKLNLNNTKKGDEIKYYNELLNSITSDFDSGNHDTSNLDNCENQVFENNRMKIEFTTTANQKNMVNENITIIDLGECETLLKEYYNKQDDNLYIKKIDIAQDNMKIPKIEYNIYYKTNKSLEKVNISICENTKYLY